jgi:hypothetical protein
MSKIKIALLISLCFVIICHVRAAGQQCARLQGTSPDGLVSYLSAVLPDPTNAACVTFAINKLGDQRYEQAIPTLAKRLDFHWPPGVRQKQARFVVEHDGSSIYPAANALKQMGAKALPAVLDAIRAGSTSRTAVEVAVSVWMTIYKDQAPTGVALLKQESDRTADPMTRQKIAWAARKAAGWCAPSEEPQCRIAAQTLYSRKPGDRRDVSSVITAHP